MSELTAIAAWQAIVGEARVSTDPDSISAAQTATFTTGATVLAIVQPTTREQVAPCLAAAAMHGVALHPISRGKNWGFGCRVPLSRRAAVLDLSALDRVVRLDAHAAFITVEPGVSFRRVSALLAQAAPLLFLPAIGGSPNASVIGNALERGHGIGPNSRRADSIGSLEVAMADGSTVTTGFAPGTGFSGVEAHRYGLGPALSPLFLQSNFGVVTAMTLALERRPAVFAPFHAVVSDARALLAALPQVIMSQGLGRHVLTFWNHNKYVACTVDARSDRMTDLRAPNQVTRSQSTNWLLSGAFYSASPAHLNAATETLKELPGITELCILAANSSEAQLVSPGFLGAPSERNLRSIYSHQGNMQDVAPSEPNGCGLLQLCPLLPLGPSMLPILSCLEEMARERGFNAQVGFDCADPRFAEVFITIAYDRSLPGEDHRALACHDEILARAASLGCPPYRLGAQSAGLPSASVGHLNLATKLKSLLDPSGVIDPQRFSVALKDTSCTAKPNPRD